MPVYSYSRLRTYEDCPLKYKLCYIDGIRRAVEGVEAFVGKRFHETLKKCYDDLKYTRANTLDDLLCFYNRAWQENWNDSIVISREGMSAEHYRALGEKLIANYYKRHKPFDDDITIDTEMRILFSLDDKNKYRFMGYIDRLARTEDGTYCIHDYKTSAHLPGQEDADKDRQLGLYHIGVKQKWPEIKNVRLIWHYPAFDTELFSSRSAEAISALIEDTRGLIRTIESDTVFPPRESALCQWCEYPDLCPRRKHLYRLEPLPPDEYLKEPGVVLVNKYAELKAQQKDIEEKMDRVKEALLDYASRENCDVIKGSNCKVSISHSDKLKFPGKNDGERAGLDSVIKGAGKWEEVSALDTAALSRIIEENSWDKKLINRVIKYGRIEHSDSLHLSVLRNDRDENEGQG